MCTSGLRWFERLADLLGLQLFELQEHAAHVLADDVLFEVQLLGGALDESGALAVGLQIQCVDVKLVLSADQQVDLHHFGTEVLRKAADAVAAVVAH